MRPYLLNAYRAEYDGPTQVGQIRVWDRATVWHLRGARPEQVVCVEDTSRGAVWLAVKPHDPDPWAPWAVTLLGWTDDSGEADPGTVTSESVASITALLLADEPA